MTRMRRRRFSRLLDRSPSSSSSLFETASFVGGGRGVVASIPPRPLPNGEEEKNPCRGGPRSSFANGVGGTTVLESGEGKRNNGLEDDEDTMRITCDGGGARCGEGEAPLPRTPGRALAEVEKPFPEGERPSPPSSYEGSEVKVDIVGAGGGGVITSTTSPVVLVLVGWRSSSLFASRVVVAVVVVGPVSLVHSPLVGGLRAREVVVVVVVEKGGKEEIRASESEEEGVRNDASTDPSTPAEAVVVVVVRVVVVVVRVSRDSLSPRAALFR